MRDRDYERRIGLVYGIACRVDPGMLASRANQVCRTWRSFMAWRLAVALREIGALP